MTISSRSIFFLFLFSLVPLVAESSEYMLFSPRPLEGELLMPERGKGVLVRRITIKKGDTLSQISRDFSGKGSYYPQILLFNDIRNPDRIFAGRELMVPISKQDALTKTFPFKKNVSPPVDKSTLRKTKRADMTAVKAAAPVKRKQLTIAKEPLPDKQTPGSESLVNTSEQDAYSKAVSAYDRGEYAMALSLFNRFLERYPSSSRDSDASLYKAECLLKLSDQ